MGAWRLELENTREVATSPERLWEVFTDAARWPEWCGPVRAVHTVPEPWEKGAELAYTLTLLGVPVGFRVQLDTVEPPHRIAWSATKWWGVSAIRSWCFEDLGETTRIVDTKVFFSRIWPVGWLYPVGVIEGMSREWLADLEREGRLRE